jgi:hypothetical protein
MDIVEISVSNDDRGTDYIEIVVYSQALLKNVGFSTLNTLTTLFPSIALPNHFESSERWH